MLDVLVSVAQKGRFSQHTPFEQKNTRLIRFATRKTFFFSFSEPLVKPAPPKHALFAVLRENRKTTVFVLHGLIVARHTFTQIHAVRSKRKYRVGFVFDLQNYSVAQTGSGANYRTYSARNSYGT